jgi:hypothetical protein
MSPPVTALLPRGALFRVLLGARWTRETVPSRPECHQDDPTLVGADPLVDGASLGEVTRTPAGHEATTAGLVRTTERMRK